MADRSPRRRRPSFRYVLEELPKGLRLEGASCWRYSLESVHGKGASPAWVVELYSDYGAGHVIATIIGDHRHYARRSA